MSKNKLLALLSLFVLASMVLAACGGAATSEPTPTLLPTDYKTIAATGYGFSWSGPGDVKEDNGYIIFTTNDMIIYVQSVIESNTVESFGQTVSFTISVEETERSTGFTAKDQPDCERENGGVVNNGTASTLTINENGKRTITCTLSNGDVVVASAVFGKLSSAGQTLTAMPANTETPNVTTTPVFTSTPIFTATPTTTGTLPTVTATPLGDNCPFIDSDEYELRFKFDAQKNIVNVLSTKCNLIIPNGKKVYGTYYGEVNGRDTWTFAFTVGKDGVMPGILTNKTFVIDSDKCWHISQKNGYQYYMCPRPATTTPTVTMTPTSTSTPSFTATYANTATPRP